ncbi:MAG: ATP-binding protein [Planctomycetota bacterium]|nr:ATP-binding protein [Planctomycetota bacterium]
MSAGDRQPATEADVLIRHDPEDIRCAERELLDAVNKAHYSEASSFAIRLALEEALYNAFRHGHRNLPEEPVRLNWRVRPDEVRITVEDRGPGFNPDAVPDPTDAERLELPHGRGVMLMRAYMAEVHYNDRGNRVTLVYRKPDAAEQ